MPYIKECVLMDRECTECGECDICDLDPDKICDNCCRCIDKDADFKSIEVDEIIEDESMVSDLEDWKYQEDYIVDYGDKDNGTAEIEEEDEFEED